MRNLLLRRGGEVPDRVARTHHSFVRMRVAKELRAFFDATALEAHFEIMEISPSERLQGVLP